MKSKLTAIVCCIVLSGSMMQGCGEAPDLPPVDSMILPEFNAEQAQSIARQSGGTAVNITVAAVSVGLVTVAVNLALLIPKTLYGDVISQKAKRSGDKWLWEKSYLGLGVTGELYAWVDEKIQMEMHVSGASGNLAELDDFIWYTGEHDVTNGVWKIYSPDYTDGSVLDIDWEINSDTDRSLIFTNVTTGMDESGDSIAYELHGTTASMTIVDMLNDENVQETFSVEYDVKDGSGKMTAEGDEYCWDTFENGQLDVDCP